MKKLLLVLALATLCFAEVPHLTNYQGKLTAPDGVAIDVATDITFRIYDDPGAGTLLWSESHAAVPVSHGLFDIILGLTTPLDLPFDEQYWIELEVDGEVLTPRQPLTSVPYAFRAAWADSAHWDGIEGIPDSVFTGEDADWQVSGDDMYSIPTGNVGIGTSSPDHPLQVGEASSYGVDQQNTSASSPCGWGANGWSQSFTAGIDGMLTAVEVKLYDPAAPMNATAWIYSGMGIGGPLLTSEPFVFTDITWSPCGSTHVDLSTPVPITSGNVYTMHITAAAIFQNIYSGSNPYAGGQICNQSMGEDCGSPFDSWDAWFKTFVEVPGNPVVITSSGDVGIGTTSPIEKLDVNGTAKMTGFKMPTGAADGYVLTSDATGTGTWQEATGRELPRTCAAPFRTLQLSTLHSQLKTPPRTNQTHKVYITFDQKGESVSNGIEKNRNDSHISPFERIKRVNEAGNEFWNSRDMARILEYGDYRNFESVVRKARMACFNSGNRIEDHFVDVNDMVQIGSSAMREVNSVLLSRYACYLIIQNADPRKDIVAIGQTYFAMRTLRPSATSLEKGGIAPLHKGGTGGFSRERDAMLTEGRSLSGAEVKSIPEPQPAEASREASSTLRRRSLPTKTVFRAADMEITLKYENLREDKRHGWLELE